MFFHQNVGLIIMAMFLLKVHLVVKLELVLFKFELECYDENWLSI